MSNKLKFGLPKGSLQEATIEKMAKAGFNITVSSRSYIPHVDDEEMEIRLIRAQEISRYVEHGYLDCGITGHDWVIENGSKVHEVGEFLFSKATRQPARWVLCVPENSPVKSVKDLQGKRIATEVVNLTKKYLKKNGVKAEVEFSWGATEVKAHELVDAIVEVTETGSSLKANKLRIVDELLVSTPRLIANADAWKNPWKRKKIETLAMLLKGALDAEAQAGGDIITRKRLSLIHICGQPPGLEGYLEARQNRNHGPPAQGRAGGGDQSGPENEHRREKPGLTSEKSPGPAQPHHRRPEPERLGCRRDDH